MLEPAVAAEQETEEQEGPPDPRSTGKRIEVLLEASSAAGPAVRERSEELVRLVVDLYGAGLERLLELVDEVGGLSGDLLARLADDELVASLLLVSGLHPYGVEERVGRALDSVRPYLGSHGGDIEFVGISETGTVQLRMLGSCDGCPSSSVTLELAVTEAIEAAAPEITGIEVEEASPAAAPAAGLISVESLRMRTRSAAGGPGSATADPGGVDPGGVDPGGADPGGADPGAAPARGGTRIRLDERADLADLPDGAVQHRFLDGVPVLLCRWRGSVYAYRDLCPQCASDFTAGTGTALLTRGPASNAPLVTCPGCHRHFDVHHAGAGLESDAGHLEPFPLLDRDGHVELVLPASLPAVPA